KRLIRADGFHNAGKKIENADVEDDPFARMVVAQELGQLGQGLLHWSRVISKGAVKGLARMRVRQTKSPQRNGLSRGLQQTRREQPADDPKENSSVHCEFLIPVNLLATISSAGTNPCARVTDPSRRQTATVLRPPFRVLQVIGELLRIFIPPPSGPNVQASGLDAE